VNRKNGFLVLAGVLGLLCANAASAQESLPPDASTPQERQGRNWGGQEGGQRPVFGKITALKNGGMEITRPDGQVLTVKFTDQTEFRKDREKATAADFRVGDMVMVRGDENPDHSVTAKIVGTRSGGPGGGMQMGTLGKDYVAGEVKAIDAPRLTVLRPDNVMQTLELNEETSLRKGRESITMADIQVGDHLIARGAVQNDVFVPKGVMVMNPDQWKRMQEMGAQFVGPRPAGSTTAPDSKTEPPAKPQEQPR
jgi:hypothetical protein